MVGWIRKSLGRKAILLTIIMVLLALVGLFQALYYASRRGFILADKLRNHSAANNIIDRIDRDSLMYVCELGEKFYLSHDNLYADYQNDEESIRREFSSVANDPGFSAFCAEAESLIWNEGADTGRLVLVDYSNGTFFTFYSTNLDEEPGEGIWLYQSPGQLEMPPVSADNPTYDTSVLERNRTPYGLVTSVTYLIYEAEGHPFRIYLFLDTDEIFSGYISGYSIRYAIIAMLVATILIGFIILMLVRHQVIEPLNSLSRATGSLIANLADEKEREYVYQNININTGDEIEHLYHSVRAMEEGIYNYMDQLKSATAEKERIGTELYIAESIQKHMLPSAEPDFSNQPCFDLAASMHPAKEVGGDFYDFFMLAEDKLAFLIADVSGKGVPAALVMAIGKTMLKNYTKETGSISEAFRIVNNVLLDVSEESMFITAFGAVLDLRTGELTYVNAGHEDPFVMRVGETFVLKKEKHAIVLGAVEAMCYRTQRMELRPGDRIYIYTDGVPEAQDHDHGMFGLGGTCGALNEVRDESAAELIAAVRESVDIFVKDEPQFDDMTMLCLDFKAYYAD